MHDSSTIVLTRANIWKIINDSVTDIMEVLMRSILKIQTSSNQMILELINF